jgi:hypothetical protein
MVIGGGIGKRMNLNVVELAELSEGGTEKTVHV